MMKTRTLQVVGLFSALGCASFGTDAAIAQEIKSPPRELPALTPVAGNVQLNLNEGTVVCIDLERNAETAKVGRRF